MLRTSLQMQLQENHESGSAPGTNPRDSDTEPESRFAWAYAARPRRYSRHASPMCRWAGLAASARVGASGRQVV
jgi:hypothetical protein